MHIYCIYVQFINILVTSFTPEESQNDNIYCIFHTIYQTNCNMIHPGGGLSIGDQFSPKASRHRKACLAQGPAQGRRKIKVCLEGQGAISAENGGAPPQCFSRISHACDACAGVCICAHVNYITQHVLTRVRYIYIYIVRVYIYYMQFINILVTSLTPEESQNDHIRSMLPAIYRNVGNIIHPGGGPTFAYLLHLTCNSRTYW